MEKKQVHTGKVQRKRAQTGKRIVSGRRRRKRSRMPLAVIVMFLFCLFLVFVAAFTIIRYERQKAASAEALAELTGELQTEGGNSEIDWFGAPELDVQLLTVNEYSRPGIALNSINGIVVHYTANPGSTARENRDYFEGLKTAQTTKASSHFIIGLDGEVVQCIPTSEIAYASNDRNSDTISIECCHPDETGKFNDATYDSLIQLTAWLCKRFNLDSSQVIRHYDVTGKNCPKYFVEHEDAWEQFREDVAQRKEEIIQQEKEG